MRSLRIGGRWDLNQQIDFAQRLLDGISAYSNGQTDLFFPSSPYFPGVGYLSYLYNLLGFTDVYLNNIILLITAVSVGFVFFKLLIKLTSKIYPNISSNIIFLITAILFTTHFRSFIVYMIEFKPDAILLVTGLIAVFFLEKNDKPNNFSLVIVGILLFCATFFKQSSFLIYILVYLFVILNNFISVKHKIVTLTVFSTIGVLALFLMFFNIENLYYYTVEVISKHEMLGTNEIFHLISRSFIYNILFCFSLIYFFCKRYKNFSFKQTETKYFIFALIWFSFSLLSAFKIGGNKGNVEVGLIVFIPFAIFAINDILKNFFQKQLFHIITKTILFVGIFSYSYLLFNDTKNYISKVKNDKESIEFLSKVFKNKNVFVDGYTYVVSKESKMNILTEAETLSHFNNIPNYDMTKVKNAIDQKIYDLIFLDEKLDYLNDKEIEKKIYKNYEFYLNKNLPSQLKNKILIPK
tara:strand:- start:178 stop:1575 length:1398 start_codon:yes stop_codon:yes gene_type:complete